jgi:hypothetical protein
MELRFNHRNKKYHSTSEIHAAMKNKEAERDKRAAILQAEENDKVKLERAEGETIEYLTQKLKKKPISGRAEVLESQLLEADGKAKAIEIVAKAEAEANNKVNRAILNQEQMKLLLLEASEALKGNANGLATRNTFK